MSDTNHVLAALSTIGIILLVLACIGIIAFFVFLLRQGVRYSIGDLMLASLVLGISPSFAAQLSEEAATRQSVSIWVGSCALTVMVAIYLLYSFYWASIRPAETPRGQLKQRFLGAFGLALIGSIAMVCWQALQTV